MQNSVKQDLKRNLSTFVT